MVGLRQKDLTSAQAGYITAYAPGNVLVPTQDYKKQGLCRNQQYTVLVQDCATNQLTLETPTGQILTIDPAQCQKKTVYEVQPFPIAAGDRLRWTKNDRNTGIRNGQTFTVDRIAPDGTAQITNSDGKTIEVNLSGRQYLNYAWVSTTYSSQGKTADRVLARMDGITTNRESFYVTVSRAKHHLALYTSNKAALIEQAQRTKAKENVSDYIPLFQVVPNHAQTSQTPIQFVPASGEHRDLAKRIGERVGERIANRIRQQLTADHSGTDCPPTASIPTGTANAADTSDVAAFASTLESHVEPLSDAIAGFLEQRDLIECTGDLAQAVTAVNCSLEYLEQSTENRAKLAAAIDRLHAAVGTKIRWLRENRPFTSKPFQRRTDRLMEVPFGATERQSVSDSQPSEQVRAVPEPRERYRQMWKRYSHNVQANNLMRLDYRVAQKAFEDGQSQRTIALMLTAGSPYVAQINREQDKEKARNYVNQTARAVCLQAHEQKIMRGKQKERELEL